MAALATTTARRPQERGVNSLVFSSTDESPYLNGLRFVSVSRFSAASPGLVKPRRASDSRYIQNARFQFLKIRERGREAEQKASTFFFLLSSLMGPSRAVPVFFFLSFFTFFCVCAPVKTRLRPIIYAAAERRRREGSDHRSMEFAKNRRKNVLDYIKMSLQFS